MLPPIDRCVGSVMFSGCPSVSLCFRVYVLLARYFTNQWTEFHHQTLVGDVDEGTDGLIKF